MHVRVSAPLFFYSIFLPVNQWEPVRAGREAGRQEGGQEGGQAGCQSASPASPWLSGRLGPGSLLHARHARHARTHHTCSRLISPHFGAVLSFRGSSGRAQSAETETDRDTETSTETSKLPPCARVHLCMYASVCLCLRVCTRTRSHLAMKLVVGDTSATQQLARPQSAKVC